MENIINYARKILFHFRWVFMSQEKRYVYLWNRTMEGMQ
jgi:hypothetical protein